MGIIEEIKQRLFKYPHVKYKVSENAITIFPTSGCGFEISLFVEADHSFTVFFEGWHEEFEEKEDALNCLAFGLSTDCRLKVSSRGSFSYKWTVEFREDDKWKEEATTALFFYPFWRNKTEHYLQNDLIG